MEAAMMGYNNEDGGGGGDQDETSCVGGGDGGGSQSRRWRETEALQLKKILEWELSLDARDLRSHAWYHGAIARAKAEQIVAKQDGDFLVRDCTSQPGNYVLSCRSKGQNLHFVINKIVLQADTVYESVQYRFEDDGFDTVPDLITYYVGSGKPITVASAARIQNPQNRRHPLSFCLDAATAAGTTAATATATWTATTPTFCASYSPTARRRMFAITTMQKKRSGICSRCDLEGGGGGGGSIRTKNTQTGSGNVSFSTSLPRQRTTAASGRAKTRCSSFCAQAEVEPLQQQQQQQQQQLSHSLKSTSEAPASANHCRLRSDYNNYANCDGCDCESDNVGVGVDLEPAPPKPSRISKNWSSSDSGNGSDDSVQSCNVANGGVDDCQTDASCPRKMSGVIIKNPKYCDRIEGRSDCGGGGDGVAALEIDDAAAARTSTVYERSDVHDENDISYGLVGVHLAPATAVATEVPAKESPPPPVTAAETKEKEEKSTLATSVFDLDAFHTLLLPAGENKPLDTCALQGVHMLLMDSGSRILANHLTRADLELTVNHLDLDRRRDDDDDDCGGDNTTPRNTRCKTGIELSLLPQGRRRRLDLIERSECLRLLVAVTVLTCATELERAELLNKWIEVAIETKTALGNLYGFCGIMLGLCSPQVQRLNETWHILRQRYTDSAFNFEAKLRPTLKCMNESTNPLAPNTTIPHLLPVALLYERSYPSSRRVHASNDDRVEGEEEEENDDDILRVENTYVWNVCIEQWEASSPDLGLSTLYSHLNATRQFHNSLPTFRRNAEIVLTDSKVDHLLRDVFRTEFHLKFLWGSRGAKVNAAERYYKFHQVLNVMSEKCESSETTGDARAIAIAGVASDVQLDVVVDEVHAVAVVVAESAADSPPSSSYNSRHATSV